MKCLLNNRKPIFLIQYNRFRCTITLDINCYQSNQILSFAILDLAYKIIEKRKREYNKRGHITLKKRNPITHLLNYVDVLNFNTSRLGLVLSSKNKYQTELSYGLYYYRSKHFKKLDPKLLKDCLKVIEHEDSYVIRFDDYFGRIQPSNVNLVAMTIHTLYILEPESIDAINTSGIVFYCTLLT